MWLEQKGKVESGRPWCPRGNWRPWGPIVTTLLLLTKKRSHWKVFRKKQHNFVGHIVCNYCHLFHRLSFCQLCPLLFKSFKFYKVPFLNFCFLFFRRQIIYIKYNVMYYISIYCCDFMSKNLMPMFSSRSLWFQVLHLGL